MCSVHCKCPPVQPPFCLLWGTRSERLTSSGFCWSSLVQVLREVLSGGGTVLLVAHNLKSVETADRIIFIENGEVVEEGTHPQLMAKRGRYYHSYQNCNVLQSRTSIWHWCQVDSWSLGIQAHWRTFGQNAHFVSFLPTRFVFEPAFW